MDKSLYFQVIANLFPSLAVQILEEKKGDPDYSFLERLTEEYSIDGTFEVLTGSKKTIKADIVAMDSSAPLKTRPTLNVAYGKVPKILQGRKMLESDIKRINIMRAKFGDRDDRVRDAVFNDSRANVEGILDTMEELFLKGLSAGVVNIGADNVGLTEVRLDYGFKASQKRGVPVVWTNTATSTPIDDINDIVTRASQNGTRLTEVHMNATTFGLMLKSAQTKEALADVGYITERRLKDFFRDEMGLSINVITRVVTAEIDGVQTTTSAWTDGMVTFTQGGILGSVFYTDTAEHEARSECSLYAEPNAYILASMWRDVNPIREQSNAQAMALPVITDVDNIWQLNTLQVQA